MKILLVGICLLMTTTGRGQFSTPNGIASYIGGTTHLIQLTSSSAYNGIPHSGSIWTIDTLDFTHSFEIDFDAKFDKPSLKLSGGAGLAIVFGNNITSTSINSGGKFLGYYSDPGGTYNPDFNHSIAVEIDTKNDYLYPPYAGDFSSLTDHTMIAADGMFDLLHTLAAATNLPTANIKDNIYRHYRINWNACLGLLRVYYRDTIVNQAIINPITYFTSPNTVFWGFTGAIGADGDNSNQYVQNVARYPVNCGDTATGTGNSGGGSIGSGGSTGSGGTGRHVGCNEPCPSLLPISLIDSAGTFDSGCWFKCISGPTMSSCWTPIKYVWISSWPGGSDTDTHYPPYPTSGMDSDILRVPTGYGATLSLTVTFVDSFYHICTSGPITHSASCNGGHTGWKLTGVSNIINDKEVYIYPNPASDMISILSKTDDIYSVKVFDMTGKLLTKYDKLSGYEAHISMLNYSNGLYVIRINNSINRMITKQ